ncbi:MAG: 1-deoxy-D-xylulose-5-phosphate synthase [Bacteroidetes bacterium GWF2_41_61]|jgi:1-deoxy-D-xylulose-5-phosphate synthase|nr:MAG: 1-deoxy-D-xylulose-5-phosphate synthase [Bacteroidetes bacterium GWE2_40_15]OFY28882.1 MAG: 1-deoxy-D-xylulose-5-phosphate synthase [Bacteroidetes bacterium GWF2_41_61]OFY89204.1 MAG: 1-deoxy-D-xylulose-5-phosphate synthase [Bacteroidetes bacterium RIFOXYA12_FULL_40_10]HBG24708.1 1-deoxy-D-xylulose-5-phosphate synthase [Rikenellaceae bacterium]HBZ26312.1 1-deoxy-D-xylulose-5-phosphate synthase [Rikenellaceae bacterium]
MEVLSKINSPDDLKELDIKDLEKLCVELRDHILTCCAKNPGHIGASLGTVELTVALHYLYNTPVDKIVWDVGHQAYSHKVLTGRRDSFINNRKYKGISGFPKMSESEYDAFGVGHSSTSISAALGMVVAAGLKKTNEKVVAVIGDGALTGGLAFEGLNNAGAQKSDLLVILNDNQISIDANVGALHNYLLKITTSQIYNETKNKIWRVIGSQKLKKLFKNFMFSTKMAFFRSGSIFESLGFRYFGVIDGNNLPLLIKTISDIKEIPGPKLLHIITKKGKGFQPAEKDQVLWHAPGTFDKNTGERISGSDNKKSRYQDVFGETLLRLARENEKIVGITPAMPSGCSMNIIMKEMPERAFDVGIAEQHAVTFSAGLAAQGLLPYCNIYSSFMQRAYDSVIHDVATQKLKVIFCLDRGGLVGEDGATHHGVFDLAYFRCIPNLTIFSPLNEVELKDILHSVQSPEYGATVIRYPRGYGEGLDWRGNFNFIEPGKAQLLQDGGDIAILSIGPVGNLVQKAIEKAKEAGINTLHYNMRFLKPIDTNALEYMSKKCKTVITVEDGSVQGGLFSAVSEYIAANSLGIKIIGLGVPDRFIEQGTVAELVAECGYDADGIYNTIMDVTRKK